MQKPIISFIIPVYNKSTYLSDCLESALKITSQSEIILVDDQSTDDSWVVCERYASVYENIVSIRLQNNCGAGEARNKGMEVANGKFVFFLDADDILNAKNFQQCLQVLDHDEEIEIVCFQEQLGSIGTFPTGNQMVSIEKFLLGGGRGSLTTSLWNYIFKFDFIRRKNIFFPATRICEDYAFVSQAIIKAERCFCFSSACYQYRKYTNMSVAMSSRSRHKYVGALAYLEILRQLENECISNVKVEAIHQAEQDMRILMLTIPGFNSTNIFGKDLFLRQLHLANYLKQKSIIGRNIYLCPACDMALEIGLVIKNQKDVLVQGFMDNRIENNPNVTALKDKGYVVKRLSKMKKKKDYICVCHRTFLTEIFRKQLMEMGLIQGEDFCCISDF